jgi:hypothetical protein
MLVFLTNYNYLVCKTVHVDTINRLIYVLGD